MWFVLKCPQNIALSHVYKFRKTETSEDISVVCLLKVRIMNVENEKINSTANI